MKTNASAHLQLILTNGFSTPTLATYPAIPSHTDHATETLFISLYVVAGTILLPGLAGNGLITVAVVKIRKLRTPTNYLLASLAISDLMMMIIMVSFLSYVLLPTIYISEAVNRFLFPSLDILAGSASIMNLMAVSLDRAIAVTFPLRYQSIVTPERVQIALRAIWFYAVLIYGFAMLRIQIQNPEYQDALIYTAYTLSFFVPFLVIICSYSFVIISAVGTLRVTKELEIVVLSSHTDKHKKEKIKRKQRKRELKAALTLTIILLPFICGWGYFFGIQVYELITNTMINDPIQNWFIYIVPWLNSSLNPVIYIMLNRPLRRSCKEMILSRCFKNRQAKNSSAGKIHTTKLKYRRPIIHRGSTSREILE